MYEHNRFPLPYYWRRERERYSEREGDRERGDSKVSEGRRSLTSSQCDGDSGVLGETLGHVVDLDGQFTSGRHH